MSTTTVTLTFSPAQLLAACILDDPHLSTAEVDADALAEAVGAGLLKVHDGRLTLTPSGGFLATSVVARRSVDQAMRMAVLSCPLCSSPGGFCAGGSCQVWPEP